MAFEELMSKLKRDMKKTVLDTSATGWLFGSVTKADPLEISLESGLIVPKKALFLSPFASEWKIKCTDNDGDGYFNFKHHHDINGQSTQMQVVTGATVPLPSPQTPSPVTDAIGHSHQINNQVTEDSLEEIRMWRGLKSGDKVLLSRVQGGQLFIVWFRLTFFDNGES
jgi:hypothetical protein